MNGFQPLIQQLCIVSFCGLIAGVGLLSAAYLLFGQITLPEVDVIDIPVAIEEPDVIELPRSFLEEQK